LCSSRRLHPMSARLIAAVGCAGVVVVAYYGWHRRKQSLSSVPIDDAAATADSRAAAWRMPAAVLSREVALVPSETAVVVIDMQNFCCHPDGGGWVDKQPTSYFIHELPNVVGCIKTLLDSARALGVECIFTTIESLTYDGRDRSLDYKISGFNVPKASWDAKVLDALSPQRDEIVLPKCSSSVFVSTNLAYKLRNLGVRQVVLVGGLTDQCIDSAVRDACDEGFLVTVVTDACYTHSSQRHATALTNSKGYARQRTTRQILAELTRQGALPPRPPSASTELAALWAQRRSMSRAGSRGCNGDVGYGSSVASLATEADLNGSSAPTSRLASSVREYIRFELVDMNGKALSKVVPARHARDTVYLYSGALSLGANSEVLIVPDEILAHGCPNAALVPDWSTWQHLPWASEHPSLLPGQGPRAQISISRVYCEQQQVGSSGTALNGAVPRTVCKRLLRELASRYGLYMYAASELEFCVAHGDDWTKPAFEGSEIFVTLQQTKVAGLCFAIEEAMEAVGVDVRTLNAEYGAGQLEITFAPKVGVGAADAASTFRTAVKELAQQRGLLATFQAKPFTLDGPGNGGHFNFSLWKRRLDHEAKDAEGFEAGEAPRSLDGLCSALHDPTAADGLSETGRHFLAGVLAHAPALEAFCSPTPPCYCRHGSWAPTVANHGPDDRLAAVRVKRGDTQQDCYFELRMPSASACAYLVIAALVAAGLDGMARQLPLPPPGLSADDGATPLPTCLSESLVALEADRVLCDALGEELVRWFVVLKRGELAAVETRQAASLAAGCSEAEAKLEAWRHFFMEYV